MTLTVIRTVVDPFSLSSYLQPGDELRVTPTGVVSRPSGGTGFFALGGGVTVFVAGRLEFGGTALITASSVGDFPPHQFRIASSGVVQGKDAIQIGVPTNLVNAGTILGTAGTGVEVTDFLGTAGPVTILNSGLIQGTSVGIRGFSGAGSTISLGNSGTIQGLVGLMGAGVAAWTIDNSGRIEGSVQLGSGVDSLTNRGVITGAIQLGAGADLFDNRLAKAAVTIDLGEGDDVARLGRQAETVSGGDGMDTVSFATSTVRIVLNLADQALNAGLALGDRFDGVETFVGSLAADLMTGDALANRLKGGAGADRISGLEGDDVLTGGQGADVMRGGLGADRFIFNDATEGGDQIADFGLGGERDRIMVSAAGFGGGLVAGALDATRFQVAADHVAQDDADRFLFDTTTRSLWFDLDGAGAAHDPVLLASFAFGVTLSASDVTVF